MKWIAALLFSFPLCAQWAPLGPFGGAASIVVADPHVPRNFVAGTRNALLFRSRDAGESWTPIPFPAQLQATLNAFAIDPQTPGIYFAALSGDLPQYSGILRSTDAGVTWKQIPDLRNQQVRAIAFKRANSSMAIGTDTGLFASNDGGSTWHRISPIDNPQLRPVVALTFDPNDSATIYAGTPHLPWKTTDGGASWSSIHTGMLDDSDVFSIQVDRNRPRRVFASACSGIYRSLNGALSWTRLSEARDASYRTYVIAQDQQYENVWFAGTTNGVVRSIDGGATWQKLGPYATRSIAFDPGKLGRILIATEEAGLLRSDNSGDTWRPVNTGFCNRRVPALWTVAGSAYATVLDAAGRTGTLQLTADLTKWIRVLASPRNAPVREPAGVRGFTLTTRGMLLATTSGLRASEDQGSSWHAVRGPLESDTIQAICRHPRKAAMVFAAKFGLVYASSDGGRTWATISPDPWPISSVTQLAVLPGAPDRLLVLTLQQGIWELPLQP